MQKLREQGLLTESTLVVIGGTENSNSNRNASKDIRNGIEDKEKIEVTAKENLGV